MIKVRPIKPGQGAALLSMVRALAESHNLLMHLEDLSVLPQFRRRGIARTLLKAVAALAIEKNYPSIYWLMMDWNKEATALYQSVGAEIEPGTSFCRTHGPVLEALAT
jgi:ribosomal protein S18 acetylase RimI-like enzyme